MDDHTYRVLDLLMKGVAVVIGAAWTYANYLRSRTYQLRCEAQVRGSCERGRGSTLLYVSSSLKNVGLAKFALVKANCGLSVNRRRITKLTGGPLSSENMGAVDVFEAHGWLEPGEQVFDEAVINLPLEEDDVALSVEMSITAVARGRLLQLWKQRLLFTRKGKAVLSLLLAISAADAMGALPLDRAWRNAGLLVPMLYVALVSTLWKAGVERHALWISRCVVKIPGANSEKHISLGGVP